MIAARVTVTRRAKAVTVTKNLPRTDVLSPVQSGPFTTVVKVGVPGGGHGVTWVGTHAPLVGGTITDTGYIDLQYTGNLEVNLDGFLKVKDILTSILKIAFTTTPGQTAAVGELAWDDANGTLMLGLKGGNSVLQLGQELLQPVKSADNTGLIDGKVVYVVGSSGDNMMVRYAHAGSEVTSATTIGVMTESATGGNKGFMTTYGLVHDIDTSTPLKGQSFGFHPPSQAA